MSEDFFSDMDFNAVKPAPGRLLISEPFLFDPHFKRAVVFLVEHNDEGSVGFILNRSVKVKINEAVEEFPEFKADLYYGGPVGNTSLFYIHTLGERLEGSQQVINDIYWGGDFEQLKLLIDTGQINSENIRFFTGYSGWAPDQLTGELEENSWIVAKCNVNQVMKARGEDFWKKTLKKMGKKFEIMSNFPEDPSLN